MQRNFKTIFKICYCYCDKFNISFNVNEINGYI